VISLVRYIDAAMRGIEYGMVGGERPVFATLPGFDGLWADGATEAEAREELESALEGWLWLGVYRHHRLPVVDGIDLNPAPPPAAARAGREGEGDK
jgi:hypothetical protein